MPREKVSTRLSATSLKSDMRERCLDLLFALLGFEPDQPRGVAKIVGSAEVVVEADRVGQIADAPLDRERLAHRIVAEHAGACRT